LLHIFSMPLTSAQIWPHTNNKAKKAIFFIEMLRVFTVMPPRTVAGNIIIP